MCLCVCVYVYVFSNPTEQHKTVKVSIVLLLFPWIVTINILGYIFFRCGKVSVCKIYAITLILQITILTPEYIMDLFHVNA